MPADAPNGPLRLPQSSRAIHGHIRFIRMNCLRLDGKRVTAIAPKYIATNACDIRAKHYIRYQ